MAYPAANSTADASIQNHGVMSALDSDILKPDIARTLYRPYYNEWKTFARLDKLGFNTASANEEYKHFEKDRSHALLKVKTVGTSSATSQVLVIDGTIGDAFYPRVKDTLMYGVAGGTPMAIRLNITAVDKATRSITVVPQNSGDSLAAAYKVTTSHYLNIYSGVSGEGADTVDSVTTRVRKYTNYLQIIDENVSVTGTSLTDQTWFNIGGKDSGSGIYTDAIADAEGRLMLKTDGMFWWGIAGGNQVDSTSRSSGVQKTSDGLFSVTSKYGNEISGFDGSLAKFDEIGKNIITNNGNTADPVWVANGYGLARKTEAVLLAANTTTDSTYLEKTTNDKLYKTGNSYGAYTNFTYLQRNSFTYMFETIESWSNASTYGVFNVENDGIAIPMGKVKDQYSKGSFGTIGMRYKAYGEYNRKFMIDNLIGFGSNKNGETITSSIDLKETLVKANVGNQFMEVVNFTKLSE